MDRTIKFFLLYNFAAILFSLIIFLLASYFYLYGSAIERERSMLLTVANSNSKLIEAVAKFDAKFSQTDDPGGSEGATLSQIKDFVAQFSNGNQNYTIQIIKMIDGNIKVISSSSNIKSHFSELWYSQNKELLTSVINGASGTNICNGGMQNDLVLAYSKINVLEYGILISVNLKKIRDPYIHSLYIGILMCLFLTLFFGYIIRKKAQPVIEKLNAEISQKTNALETLKKNEERLDIALSVNNDGIFDLDVETFDIFFDERFFGIAGYKPIEFPCKFEEWINRIHDDDRQRIENAFKNYLEGKLELFDVEYRFKMRNNNWMWLRSRVKIINRNNANKAKRIIGTNTDITERKIAELELRKNEENLKVTLNSIGDAVITTDTDGNITRMNPIAEKLTGWTIAEAIGKKLNTIFKIIKATTREPAPNPVDLVLSTKEIVGLANHTILVSKNLKEFHIADSGAPIKSENGPIIGVILVFRDVTNDYMMQHQLRHSQKMDAVGQLASGIAHDFNNMLGGILMSTGLLNKHVGNIPEAQRPLKLISESAKHATVLTQKLLSFSRKESFSTTSTDLHSIIRDTVSLLETTIDKRISLKLKLEAKTSKVMGDDSSLQSCILNLGINASHAMPNGGEILFITKSIDLDESYCNKSAFNLKPGQYIQLEVIDSGVGISPEIVPRIFEPFFTTKPLGKGTGLGLSTVYGTIQQHQGAINVNSKINVGTTFQILLPIFEGCQEANSSSSELVHNKGEGLILIADDQSIILETAKESLEDIGYKVLTADNGGEALEIYKNNFHNINIVILDMMMPIMNGLDCFIAMKKVNADVSAILTTGYIKEKDLDKIQSEGISAFIKKPYNADELIHKIQSVLQLKKSNKKY